MTAFPVPRRLFAPFAPSRETNAGVGAWHVPGTADRLPA